jgi:Predicted ATPase
MNDPKLYVKSIDYYKQDIDSSEYPFNLGIIHKINDLLFDNSVTFIIGENGSGKSTILECIASLCGYNIEGGSKNNCNSQYNEIDTFAKCCRLVRYPFSPRDGYFYRAETYYNLISELDNLGISQELFAHDLHNRSRGEGILDLMHNRFFGNGLYVIDEPESGLSIDSQMKILIRMHELVGQNSQLIISTHSPIILSYPNAKVYELSEGSISNVDLHETDLYTTWKLFFQESESFIEKLLLAPAT